MRLMQKIIELLQVGGMHNHPIRLRFVTTDQLTTLRFQNQHIIQTEPNIHSLVSFMGAIQGQDYNSALWSIGLRTGKTEREVIESIEKNEIVRTWSQRGTLHFVAAEDAKWMVDLSAPRMHSRSKRRHAELGLDEDILESSKALFADALRGGVRLIRPKLMELLEKAGFSTIDGRGYHLLGHAAQTGLIYMGPMEEKQQTFGLIADLPVKSRELNEQAAIAELTLRYFQSHGPATIQDFCVWAGLTTTQAKTGLEANKSTLRNDGEYWLPLETTKSLSSKETLLLPGFDEYIIGYRDRSVQLKADHFKRVVPGGNGIFMPTVVIDGQIVGLWRRTIKKEKVIVSLEPFERFSTENVALIEVEAQKYAAYLDLQLEMA